MCPSPDLRTRLLRGLGVALAATALVACGGSDDDDVAAGGGGAAALTCETKQFAAGTVVSVPTEAQLAPFAKTYTSGANTVVLSASGGLTVNAKTITVASTCLVKEGAADMLMLSWGTPMTVGAGNILYDNHIDFRAGGMNGALADGTIL